jgi:hypothetical protein
LGSVSAALQLCDHFARDDPSTLREYRGVQQQLGGVTKIGRRFSACAATLVVGIEAWRRRLQRPAACEMTDVHQKSDKDALD